MELEILKADAERKKLANRANVARHYEAHKDEMKLKQLAYKKANREKINATRSATALAKKQAVALPPAPKKKRLIIKGFSFAKLDDLIGDKIANEESKSSHLKAIKSVLRIMKDVELENMFKNADKLIEGINTGKSQDGNEYSLATKMKQFESVLKISSVLNIPLDRDKIIDAYTILKMKLQDEKESKPDGEYPTFTTYLEQCKAMFGADSREFLIASMYAELTCRNDFNLTVSDKKLKGNYLLVQKTKMTIVLNEYKTAEKYGEMKHKCSASLRKLILAYIEKNGIKIGDLLFGVVDLQPVLSLMNKRLGYSTGANLFRHMRVAEVMNDPSLTYEQRLETAKNMMHNCVTTQKKYLK
jgi:hypothetical protein